jgi:hypothetical protein
VESILLGIVCIGLGLAMLFAKDLMWALTEWGNSFKGLTSERTENWELGQNIAGVVLVLLGLLLVLFVRPGV